MKRIAVSACSVILALLMLTALSQPAMADAPVAGNLEITTYRNVSVGGTLRAGDIDGDELSFEITTPPVKGSIELHDDGSFVYTPDKDRKGRDYFGYRAIDSDGNASQEATVIIRIEKQKTDTAYIDLQGSPYGYAAAALSEYGIYTGEKYGGVFRFGADEEVSRGEFITLCMLASGADAVTGVYSTGYADDADIPAWLKGYVMTAVMADAAGGSLSEEGVYFMAEAPVTRAEAAVMLASSLQLEKASYILPDPTADTETARACADLSACGINIRGGDLDSVITRGEAAEYIAAAYLLKK